MLNDRGYEVVTKIVAPNGKIKAANGAMNIKEAEYVMLTSRIVPIDDYLQSAIQQTKNKLDLISAN